METALRSRLDRRFECGWMRRSGCIPDQKGDHRGNEQAADPGDDQFERIRLVSFALLPRRRHNTSSSAAVAPSTVTRLSDRIMCTLATVPVSIPIRPNVQSM